MHSMYTTTMLEGQTVVYVGHSDCGIGGQIVVCVDTVIVVLGVKLLCLLQHYMGGGGTVVCVCKAGKES